MTPERYQQVKSIFLAARDLEASAAAGFLDRVCGDDAELRREVESLLAHDVPTTVLGDSPTDAGRGKLVRPLLDPAVAPGQPPAAARAGEPPGGPSEPLLSSGEVVAGRYRIVGLLGRGGMGEVYRADDLKLGQTVALKFLLSARADDPHWLERFHAEVRLARRVTSPFVNRVHDIGHAEGHPFISMEYVDGEDLASLMRRVGRLPAEKVLEVARQLCAGLGAAHDAGVLHRDLKPSNVMIDGHGRVRILDFGIAVEDDRSGTRAPLAGTPAFMAPELFEGRSPSVRSDLYALGAVLYELATGKEPFGGAPPGRRERPTPTAPSVYHGDVDPRLERAILRCLEHDPARRPASAYEVAAALPGGDLLAAALAGQEGPSPGLVAAAGGATGISLRAATLLLAAVAAGLAVVTGLADSALLLPQAGLEKPPAVMADKAQDVIERLGYELDRSAVVQGFTVNRPWLDLFDAGPQPGSAGPAAAGVYPAPAYFWFRQGDWRLGPPAPFGEPALLGEFPAEPGMITVRLDGRGRLLLFEAVPRREAVPAAPPKPADWSAAFRLAGLEPDRFRPVALRRGPPVFADAAGAWEGTRADEPQVPLHCEAASLDGRIDYFEVTLSGEGSAPMAADSATWLTPSRTFVARVLFYTLALVAGLPLAWRHRQLGRGDPLGAKNLAAFVFGLGVLDWLVGQRHVAVFSEEATLAYLWTAQALLGAAGAWVIYMAAEPLVRRRWPQMLISWTRLLRGRWSDPLVARDVLIGCAVGVVIVLVWQADSLLGRWAAGAGLPFAKLPGPGDELGELLGLRFKAGTAIGLVLSSLWFGLVLSLLALGFRTTLRVPWLAMVAFWVLLWAVLALISVGDTYLPWVTGGLVAAVVVLNLTRVGLLSVMVAALVARWLVASPVTLDSAAWYFPAGMCGLAAVAALATAAWYAAAGRLWRPGW